MGPNAKKARVADFRAVVGESVTESVLVDILNRSNGDLERAINVYFNSKEGVVRDLVAAPPSRVTSTPPSFIECVCIGSISCLGGLTTKLAAASNELYMDAPLNCSFSIRPPVNAPPSSTPAHLADLLHGSSFIRFSIPGQRSEIGRLPAPLAAALCPLVKLGLAEVSVNVGFPGCAGLNLNPGASVPIRVDLALTPAAMNRSSSTASDDVLMEKVMACWAVVLSHMGVVEEGAEEGDEKSDEKIEKKSEIFHEIQVSKHPPSAELEEANLDQELSKEASDEPMEEMTEEMTKFVNVFAQPGLPELRPPLFVFPTELKHYQAQALAWMAQREWPAGLPACIVDNACKIGGELSDPTSPSLLPPSWLELRTPAGGETLYYHEGFFTFARPAAAVGCLGGILADEMGLGKTVMTLALISLDLLEPVVFDDQPLQRPSTLFGQPTSPNLIPGGTLVIAHLSLLRQWIGELQRHCPGLTFLEFHGSDRITDVAKLAAVNVVFSTYGTVAVNIDQSPLIRIGWRRVVLDEAHTIRTRATKMAKAVNRLNADRRWCLTGTPLQNSLEDIYPLLAWLRVAPWRSFGYFRQNILQKLESGVGLDNAQSMLKPLMLRRTKAMRDSQGRPLVELPVRVNKVVQIALAPEEKDFYTALFWQTKLEFDKFEKSNQVMYNITHILQLLIRLRQALCHPSLCRSALLNQPPSTGLNELLEKFLQTPDASSSSSFSSKTFLVKTISDLKTGGLEHVDCVVCFDDPCQFPVLTPCGHILCRKCCMGRLRQECPICRHVFPNTDIHPIAEPENGPPALSSKLRVLMDYVRRDMRLGRRVIVFSQFVSFIAIIGRVFEEGKIPFKTLHGGHNVGQRESAVSWLSEADLSHFDRNLETHPSPLVTPSDHEDDEVDPKEKAQGRVLLVSLKAGGVGLNLVAANVVYLTDLWWNPAVEEQAFQRVHRLGQTKKVYTYKFVCTDTIDERILDLQASKSEMTSDVLGDASRSVGGNSGQRKLTLEDIRQLFKPALDRE